MSLRRGLVCFVGSCAFGASSSAAMASTSRPTSSSSDAPAGPGAFCPSPSKFGDNFFTIHTGDQRCRAELTDPNEMGHEYDMLAPYSILVNGEENKQIDVGDPLMEVDPDFAAVFSNKPKHVIDEELMGQDRRFDRALGSFVSMAVGDALGAPLEFEKVRYDISPADWKKSSRSSSSAETDNQQGTATSFFGSQGSRWHRFLHSKRLLPSSLFAPRMVPVLSELGDPDAPPGAFNLTHGQWTDDAAMGLCLADSLLVCGTLNRLRNSNAPPSLAAAQHDFNARDAKERLYSWWAFGYNNHSRRDFDGGCSHSVGLGGNISAAFHEFNQTGSVFTATGSKSTSGNGSLIRNGAIPCYFHEALNLENALAVARQQSYLTHQGTEAAELCAALTYLVHFAINNPSAGKDEILGSIGKDFKTDCPSVQCLVRSEQEPGGNPDRNWQWRADQYLYAPGRAKMQPGYVGSYAMDALAMALHCVHKTDNYKDALLMAANRCGDADSVCDITGQIAGAVYGYSAIPENWLKCLQKWDGNEFTVKGFKMFYKNPPRYPENYEEAPSVVAAGGAPADPSGSAQAGGLNDGHATDSEEEGGAK